MDLVRSRGRRVENLNREDIMSTDLNSHPRTSQGLSFQAARLKFVSLYNQAHILAPEVAASKCGKVQSDFR